MGETLAVTCPVSTTESVMAVARRNRWMTLCYSFFFFFLILLACGVCGELAHTQTPSQIRLGEKNVLILNAFESNTPASDRINQGLSAVLQSGGIGIMNEHYEHLGLGNTSGPDEGCLVLDIRLPGMTGLDLQEKLVSRGAKYSVIFITAHDNPQWQERARKEGAFAYLLKPFSEQALLEAVGRCRQQTGSNKTNNQEYR